MTEQQAGRTNGCLEAGQLLAWHDGALSPREAREVMTHLEGCARCAAEDRALMRDRRQVFELLSRLDPLLDTMTAPEAALARFHQRLAVRNTGTLLNHSHENPHMGEHPLSGSERVEVLPISVRHAPRKSRVRPFVQVLAAVLVIGVLVGTMLLLLTPSHRKPRMIVGAETRVTETRGAEKGCQFYSKTAYVNNYDLSGVAALSRNDIWVIGGFWVQARDPHGLLEQWNGSQWRICSDPYPITGMQSVNLRAVAAVSTNDVWAVGSAGDGPGSSQTLIEHWNGSRWSVVPGPTLFPRPTIADSSSLTSVAVVSANDVWAVGDYVHNGAGGWTLIEHWNGTRWNLIPSPHPELASSLREVTAISANDVWAVGEFTNGTWVQTLTLHWNGLRWSIIKSPNPGKASNRLWGVTALSARDIWAVGSFSNSTQGLDVEETLTMHWDGSQWSVVSSPSPSTSGNDLEGVTAVSANDVWAVGTTWAPTFKNLIEHWNGSRWSVVKTPNLGADLGLSAVAHIPHMNTIAAVGVGSLLYINDPGGEALLKP